MQHVRHLIQLAVLLLLAACQADGPTPTASVPPEGVSQSSADIRTGYVLNSRGQPVKVTYEVIDGLAIREGDIIIGRADSIPSTLEEMQRRSGARFGLIVNDRGSNRWPSGQVRYISPINMNNPQRVLDALIHIKSNAPGVSFIAISESQASGDYIRFEGHYDAEYCWSALGKVGGEQKVLLGDNCSTATVIHEVGHALGLQHEHMRCDRDYNVEVLWNNIKPARLDQFRNDPCPNPDYTYFDEYNVASIMHYHAHAFSSNSLPTLRSLFGYELGRATSLANTDISALSVMYPAQTQVHRWYNPNHAGGDHLYTLDANEGWHHGYTLEDGDYFRVTLATASHYSRLYRCLASNHHYLSRDANCEVGVPAEGSVGRVATWQIRGTVPLYRTRNPWNGDRLATTSAAERAATLNAGWINEGTLGYVWPGN